MPCALLLIIPVCKLSDENESIALSSPYLGRHQTNQNVERTEQNRKSSRTNDKIGFRRLSLAHAQTLFSSVLMDHYLYNKLPIIPTRHRPSPLVRAGKIAISANFAGYNCQKYHILMTNPSHFFLTILLKNYRKKSKLVKRNTISQQPRSTTITA